MKIETGNADRSGLRALKDLFLQPEMLLALGAVVAFAIFYDAVVAIKAMGPFGPLAIPLVALGVCLVLPGPRSVDASPASNILLRVVAPLLAIYAFAAPLSYPVGVTPEIDTAATVLRWLAGLGLVAAVVVFWRPAFATVPACVVLAGKAIGAEAFGIGISQTDYIPVVECALFLGVAHSLLGEGLAARMRGLVKRFETLDVMRASTVLFVLAVGFHFSNYFYSGLQKVVLEGGPVLWVTDNPTHQLALNAAVGGFLPVAHWPGVRDLTLQSATFLEPFINVTILLGQLAALVCIARRYSMIGVTLFYDLTHAVIFLVSGIFFWKWIIMNLALVAGMRRLPGWVESRSVVVAGVLAVLFAPQAFNIVRLGWYDSPAVVLSEVVAVTEDGREWTVPSNYFGTVSVTAAQSRMGRPDPGHYPTVTWGTTQEEAVFREAAADCRFAVERWQYPRTEEEIARIVRLIHAYALQREAATGRYAYDLFPHHIWSNPFMFKEFAALPKSEISHYLYRVRSVCIRAQDGGIALREDRRDEFRIPVTRP
ncbi:hypothetical protein ACRDNQ_11275 [Palleronia sp. KMU-117]|uniref:hypothetical protein n=1 Tax=Palleronia sp. KMU-117 TaxID=3434108 RepID=UPI003D74C746